MKKMLLLASIFCSVVLWNKVPYAHRVMETAMNYSTDACCQGFQYIRKLSGFEKLRVFERKYSSEQVLAMFPEASDASIELMLVPHILMHVRYPGDESTVKKGAQPVSQEGTILWNLVEGEIVLNTSSWTCSKGLRECLLLKAKTQDIQVMQTLASLGGSASKETLSHALSLKNIPADKVIKECFRKKLIFLKDNHVTSHLPQINLIRGCTTVLQTQPVWLQKPKDASICTPHYSSEQVQKLTKRIFGSNFIILESSSVYIPMYKVSMKSSDSSVRLEYVHAITGKKL